MGEMGNRIESTVPYPSVRVVRPGTDRSTRECGVDRQGSECASAAWSTAGRSHGRECRRSILNQCRTGRQIIVLHLMSLELNDDSQIQWEIEKRNKAEKGLFAVGFFFPLFPLRNQASHPEPICCGPPGRLVRRPPIDLLGEWGGGLLPGGFHFRPS